MIRVCIAGALGRMGQALCREILLNSYFELVAVTDVKDGVDLKLDSCALKTVSDISKVDDFDILIDFTVANYSMDLLRYCSLKGKSVILGTTGFSQAQEDEITLISHSISIVKSGNFSFGVQVMLNLLKNTVRYIGSDIDVEIIETHHKNKIDAPSGTALMFGDVISNTLNWPKESSFTFDRFSNNQARKPCSIGFSAVRGGDIVGEHEVKLFFGKEEISLKHKAFDRSNFSYGALKAAKWLFDSELSSGLFNMSDVVK